jgi:hypothetical protein
MTKSKYLVGFPNKYIEPLIQGLKFGTSEPVGFSVVRLYSIIFGFTILSRFIRRPIGNQRCTTWSGLLPSLALLEGTTPMKTFGKHSLQELLVFFLSPWQEIGRCDINTTIMLRHRMECKRPV